MSSGNGTILEDDQQLYDWGIENRLDQYYQDDPNNAESYASSGGGSGQGPYYPRNYDRRQASEYASPPPAHQEAGYSQGQGRIKEEPGVDMSGWNYSYSRYNLRIYGPHTLLLYFQKAAAASPRLPPWSQPRPVPRLQPGH